MSKQKFKILSPIKNSPQPAASVMEKPETSSLVSSMLEKLETPKTETPLDCYRIIPRQKIRDNRKNDYPIVEIDSLKESILQFGLMQDIVVIYITDEDMYVIEAGHRRRTAIDQLIAEFTDEKTDKSSGRYTLYQKNVAKYERGYVCKVAGTISENEIYDSDNENDLDTLSEKAIDSEIRLIITNQEVRSEDISTRARNVQRLARLYEKKNLSLPRNERFNVNQQISKDTNLSTRQVAYYKSTENLIPELKQALFNRDITLKESSGIAKLNPAEQKEILDLIREDASKSRLQETIHTLKNKIRELEHPAPQSDDSEKLFQAEARIKSSLEQTTKAINLLLKNIDAYKKIYDNAPDNIRKHASPVKDIDRQKQILINLLA